jgi:type I restriction enzyme M protein
MLQNPTIKRLINQLWDRFWSGGISNPLTAIEQISYLLFMRMLDGIDEKRVREAEITGESYTSVFSGRFLIGKSQTGTHDIEKEKLRWSYFKNLPAADMLVHVQQAVFPFLKSLGEATSPFARHMENAVFIIPKPSLMVDAVRLIDEIFVEIDHDAHQKGHTLQDIQGDVYEHLLSEIATAGKNGQFRTPRHIIILLVELVQPEFGKRIADPACGSGGFLLGAYVYILTGKTSADFQRPDEDGFVRGTLGDQFTNADLRARWEHDCFQGYDIDQTMVRMGLMNLMMHGFANPQIDYADTLSKTFDEVGTFDYVLANPPFTGNIEKSDVNELLTLSTTKTELLFIERIHLLLRMGGTAGLIVPQGVLFGSGKAFVEARKLMVEKSELKAVVTLPGGVFKPYAGVATALLIFTKGGTTTNTWFYELKSDGRSLDDKRTKLDHPGDLPDVVTRYRERHATPPTDRKGKFFVVPKAELAENGYDLRPNKYREDEHEEISYRAPKQILAELRTLETGILKEIEELENYL